MLDLKYRSFRTHSNAMYPWLWMIIWKAQGLPRHSFETVLSLNAKGLKDWPGQSMGTFCLSSASILRCETFTDIQEKILIIPTGIELLFSGALVLATLRNSNRGKSLILVLESWSYLLLALLDLFSHVIPAARDSINVSKVLDIVIASVSCIPIALYVVFLFLFTSGEVIHDFSQFVQRILKISLFIFIPSIIIFNELASFLGISRIYVQDGDRRVLLTGFRRLSDQALWTFFTSLTLALLTTFQAICFFFLFFRLVSARVEARRIGENVSGKRRMSKGVGWVAVGLKLGAIEAVIGFTQAGFGGAMARRALRLLSRAFICFGLIRGLSSIDDDGERFSMVWDRDSQLQLQSAARRQRRKGFLRLSAESFFSGGEKEALAELEQQRVTIINRKGRAPTLELRFSSLNIPSPTAIVESLRNRPASATLPHFTSRALPKRSFSADSYSSFQPQTHASSTAHTKEATSSFWGKDSLSSPSSDVLESISTPNVQTTPLTKPTVYGLPSRPKRPVNFSHSPPTLPIPSVPEIPSASYPPHLSSSSSTSSSSPSPSSSINRKSPPPLVLSGPSSFVDPAQAVNGRTASNLPTPATSSSIFTLPLTESDIYDQFPVPPVPTPSLKLSPAMRPPSRAPKRESMATVRWVAEQRDFVPPVPSIRIGSPTAPGEGITPPALTFSRLAPHMGFDEEELERPSFGQRLSHGKATPDNVPSSPSSDVDYAQVVRVETAFRPVVARARALTEPDAPTIALIKNVEKIALKSTPTPIRTSTHSSVDLISVPPSMDYLHPLPLVL